MPFWNLFGYAIGCDWICIHVVGIADATSNLIVQLILLIGLIAEWIDERGEDTTT